MGNGRGAYHHKLGKPRLTVQANGFDSSFDAIGEYRPAFHRLLKSRRSSIIERNANWGAELNQFLDSLNSKPRCQISLVFSTCLQLCTEATVREARDNARDDAREFMDTQKAIHNLVKNVHERFHEFMRRKGSLIEKQIAAHAIKQSKAFIELLPFLEIDVQPARRAKDGRPDKRWMDQFDSDFKKAALSTRDKTHLYRIMNL